MVCWVISLITDFNPRSPDGERREVATPCCSISYFNPRSPDGERRYDAMYHPAQWRFQSTLPGWGATTMEFRTPLAGLISIHAPRMGSDITPIQWRKMTFISIHAPRMGSDNVQSGLDLRGTISIHAPRMGSDRSRRTRRSRTRYFNPRSPDGERPSRFTHGEPLYTFQSTLPGWGATWQCRYGLAPHSIFQSTLPGWGATY